MLRDLLKKKPVPSPAVQALQSVLNDGDSARIAEAVRIAELGTSSEIIVKLSAATGDEPIRTIAEAEFVRLGLPALSPSNGVLIYVSLTHKAVEIVVGAEAALQLPETLWKSAADAVADGFRTNQAANGIIHAVNDMAPVLATVFPPLAVPGIELPNVSEGQ